MRTLSSLVNAILGGIVIGIGGIVYLSVENSVIGSMLFTVGLFCIYVYGLNLYTGKVCYVFDNKPAYTGFVALVWFGNLIGTGLVGLAARATRIAGIAERAMSMSQTKLSDSLVSIFILAILCNVMIWIAAENFKKNPHEVGKYVGLFLGVMVFILSGYEHCVANMFYFTVAGVWSGHTLLYLLVMTLGNAVGGVLFPLCRRFVAYGEKATA